MQVYNPSPQTTLLMAVGTPARDLVLYFIGHGGFVGRDSDFYLAIRRTRTQSPCASAIDMMSLADTLTKKVRHLRCIIILDWCFAAAAFSGFEFGPAQVALEKTKEAFEVQQKAAGFPTKGTTLLCSSSHKSPSLLLPDSSSTMFTTAVLEALAQGTRPDQDRLSLRDVKELATDILSEVRNAPRPVVLSPDQSEGDVADMSFFPNPGVEEECIRRVEEERRRRVEEAGLPQAEEETPKAAEEQLRRAEEEARLRKIAKERARKAEEEERSRKAEEERARKTETEVAKPPPQSVASSVGSVSSSPAAGASPITKESLAREPAQTADEGRPIELNQPPLPTPVVTPPSQALLSTGPANPPRSLLEPTVPAPPPTHLIEPTVPVTSSPSVAVLPPVTKETAAPQPSQPSPATPPSPAVGKMLPLLTSSVGNVWGLDRRKIIIMLVGTILPAGMNFFARGPLWVTNWVLAAAAVTIAWLIYLTLAATFGPPGRACCRRCRLNPRPLSWSSLLSFGCSLRCVAYGPWPGRGVVATPPRQCRSRLYCWTSSSSNTRTVYNRVRSLVLVGGLCLLGLIIIATTDFGLFSVVNFLVTPPYDSPLG